MKRIFIKIASVVLAVVCVLSLNVTAFAQGGSILGGFGNVDMGDLEGWINDFLHPTTQPAEYILPTEQPKQSQDEYQSSLLLEYPC